MKYSLCKEDCDGLHSKGISLSNIAQLTDEKRKVGSVDSVLPDIGGALKKSIIRKKSGSHVVLPCPRWAKILIF